MDIRIDPLFFDGCPILAKARGNLRTALETTLGGEAS
jgi:hypothetical protein